MRKLLVSAVLVTGACAKANAPEVSNDTPTPRAGTGGSGGSSALGGSGGTGGTGGTGLGGSGGTGLIGAGGTAASGGSSAGAGGMSGTAPIGGSGGASASGGNDTAGTGGIVTAGSGGSAGTDAAGGNANASGGVASGGVGGATGGGGTGGIPTDPNWMPPDMSAAKIVVLYKNDQRQAMASSVAMTLYLMNQTDTAYDLSDVTVRYWMSSEPPPRPERYHTASNLSSTTAPVFVPNMAVSYLEWRFGATGTLPVYVDQNTLNNNGVIQAGVQSNVGVAQFNQANDWSFDATAMAAKPNPKITLYDGDTLIWGCEPSQVCAVIEPEPVGEGGAGGQSSL